MPKEKWEGMQIDHPIISLQVAKLLNLLDKIQKLEIIRPDDF